MLKETIRVRVVEDEEFAEIPGQDAFLDVLTNMVGIIILLVVVMGLRSSRAASTALVQQDPTLAAAVAAQTAAKDKLQSTCRDAVRTQNEYRHLLGQVVDARRATLFREQERSYLATFVAAFEQEVNDRRASLSADQQRDFDLRRQLADAQAKLNELSGEQAALLSQPVQAEVLESRPTPIVHRHDGKELFLQLSEGHVAVIPLADLLEEYKQHVTENLWRLKDQDSLSGTVGPIGGYRMRYLVRKRAIQSQTVAGYEQRGTAIETVKWELLPIVTPLGEPVDQAVAPNSELFQQLKNFPPSATIIAIGVYPDSLRELHRLKRTLQDAGYGIAEKLMAAGEVYGFSPHGQAVYAQ